MLYRVIKSFKSTCGDNIKHNTILDEYKNCGDYTVFTIDEPYTNEYIYLNDEEIKKFLVEQGVEFNDMCDWFFL